MTSNRQADSARAVLLETPVASNPLPSWLPGVALVLATCLAYAAVWRAGFIWDDDSFLTNNSLIKQANGLYRLWFTTESPDYFPLTSTTLWLEWRLWGMNPLGYHVMNVLLHAASAVFWWRVLTRLKLPGAWLAAAIFALHPVNVESVAWITERKNTLTMFFYALTALWFLKAEDSGRRAWYWASAGSFLCSLLSKTSVTPLPVVLLGLAWWRRGKIARQDWMQAAPFFGLSLALGLVTMWFQSERAIGDEIIRQDGFTSRLAVAGCAIWFYLYKALLPLNLSFVYPRWNIDAAHVVSYLPLVLLVVALWLCWRFRNRWGRGWLFGLGYFVLMLLPVLGFVNIYFMKYSLVADHWQYFAMLGPITLVVVVMSRILSQRPELAIGGGAALLLVLGILTNRQCADYQNAESLWRATLGKNSRIYLAHLNLGAIVHDKALAAGAATEAKNALLTEAINHFTTALEIHPNDGAAQSNLGNALFMRGEIELALHHIRRALEIQPNNPEVHTALGSILFEKGQKADGLRHFQEAIRLNQNFGEAHYALGNVLFQQGQFDEAILELKAALTARRGLAEVHNTLGQALQRRGLLTEALFHFQEALKIQPRHANAHNNLGTLLLQTGNVGAAIEELQATVEIQPDFAEAHYNLGNALFQAGKTDAAIARLNRAVTLQPTNASAHNNLAGILLHVGRTEDAVAGFRTALKLRPKHAATHNNLGRALLQQDKLDEAGTHFQKALEAQTNFFQAAENLRLTVWMLATSTNDNVRNGTRGVELARQLGRHVPTNHPLYLGTLAAAYAEARQFPEAIASADKAQQLAAATTNSALLKDLQAQLILYRAGMSLHESDLTNSPAAREQLER